MKDKFSRRVILICVLLCAAAVLASIWSIKNSYSNKARVDNAIALYKGSSMNVVTRDSLLNELEMMKVKEDYFMDQVGIQSDWFIAYVSILFVIFGFIGFSVFDTQFKQMKEENSTHMRNYDAKLAQLQADFNLTKDVLKKETDDFRELYYDLKAKNYETMHGSYLHWSNTSYDKKKYAFSIHYCTRAIRYLTEAHDLTKIEIDKENMVEKIKKNLDVLIVRMEIVLENVESMPSFVKDLDYEKITQDILRTSQISTNEVLNHVTKMISLLEKAKTKRDEINARGSQKLK